MTKSARLRNRFGGTIWAEGDLLVDGDAMALEHVEEGQLDGEPTPAS